MPIFRKRSLPESPERQRCAAIVAAAGGGERMGGGGKVLLPLAGMPILAHSLLALERTEAVDDIIIAARSQDIVPIADLCRDYGISKVRHIVKGGANRIESVLLALNEIPAGIRLVAVHDGARPCVTPELCTRVIDAAQKYNAAIPCVPVVDTLKAVSEGNLVSRTADRNTFRLAQTPQCFAIELLRAALSSAKSQTPPPTDDSQAVEALGVPITVVPGDRHNIKVTTPEDLCVVAAFLSKEDDI